MDQTESSLLGTKPNIPNQIYWTQFTKPSQQNWIYKIKSTNQNVLNAKNQIYQTKSIQSNLQNKIQQTNSTKPNLQKIKVKSKLELSLAQFSPSLLLNLSPNILYSKLSIIYRPGATHIKT